MLAVGCWLVAFGCIFLPEGHGDGDDDDSDKICVSCVFSFVDLFILFSFAIEIKKSTLLHSAPNISHLIQ